MITIILYLLLKFILGDSYSSCKSSTKTYWEYLNNRCSKPLYFPIKSKIIVGNFVFLFPVTGKGNEFKMVYLQDNVGWSIEEFLDEPWMLTWRGSWINPKYLFAGVSSLVNAFSTGWRIFCSMFYFILLPLGVYHITATWGSSFFNCHLRLIIIYCHLSSLIMLLFLGGQVSDWHEYFRVRKRAVSWGLF